MSVSGNKHLLLRFLACIVCGCRDSKLNSYGNKDGDMSKFDLRGLRKIKMVCALNLKLDGLKHLERRGTYIENVLHLIQQGRDNTLNAGLSYKQEPRVHAFRVTSKDNKKHTRNTTESILHANLPGVEGSMISSKGVGDWH
ncbi:hypothetical protein JB92DRAFT_2827920 [Gautieria morchelliformis]|nr:hypothetical protein JB92DRAFT_2831551 [Gautieria morchelliformis]KAF8521351.1 hypothetical protein JB92DRAFT_2827920 [Gautieria morchelliformis]